MPNCLPSNGSDSSTKGVTLEVKPQADPLVCGFRMCISWSYLRDLLFEKTNLIQYAKTDTGIFVLPGKRGDTFKSIILR